MSTHLDRDVREWLGAEEDGLEDVAERALTRALAGLDRRAPAAHFADRVLARAGRLAPASRAWRSWWLRFPVAASLLTAGFAAAALPAALLVIIPVARAFGWPALAASWHWTARWTTVAFRSWSIVADVAAALGASLSAPAAVAVLSANVLLAAASLLGLKRLLRSPEELTT